MLGFETQLLCYDCSLARFGVEAAGHCPRCPGVIEDLVRIFTHCPCVAAVWQ